MGTRPPAPRGGKDSSHPLLPIFSRSTSSPPTRYNTTEVTSHMYDTIVPAPLSCCWQIWFCMSNCLPPRMDCDLYAAARLLCVWSNMLSPDVQPVGHFPTAESQLSFTERKHILLYQKNTRTQIQINISKEIQINISEDHQILNVVSNSSQNAELSLVIHISIALIGQCE